MSSENWVSGGSVMLSNVAKSPAVAGTMDQMYQIITAIVAITVTAGMIIALLMDFLNSSRRSRNLAVAS